MSTGNKKAGKLSGSSVVREYTLNKYVSMCIKVVNNIPMSLFTSFPCNALQPG